MGRAWPLERLLFALTLLSVLLALFVAVGACPASLLLERLAGIERRCSP